MIASKKFQRTVENFVCEHCAQSVHGNGYTNHCPYCLWSKHVDINPGDRAADCGGLMKPIGLSGSARQWKVVHRCERCGYIQTTKTSSQDDMKAIIRVSTLKST